MNIWDIVIGAVIVAAAACAIYKIVKDKKSGKGCSCGCGRSDCSGCAGRKK